MNSLKLVIVSLILVYYAAGCGKAFQGPAGTPGVDAKPCTVSAIANGAQITCPDGTTQTITNGVQGEQGIVGETGPAGVSAAPCTAAQTDVGATITCPGSPTVTVANGSDGTNATSVTVVQLCPSYGPTQYPDSFPEQALCVSNNLYGVYWSGTQAFLAEIVPGAYASTSPDGCTLTVSENCQVTQD